jgi:transcription elongation factor Elf1
MGRFLRAFRVGVASFKEGMGPSAYQIAGRTVHCPHCAHEKFVLGRALLNSAGATFLNLDWADPAAATLVCAECGRIEWFAQEPERVSS